MKWGDIVLVDLSPVLGNEAGLRVKSKIHAEQIRSIDITRVHRRLGRIPSTLVQPLHEALALHLDRSVIR